MLIHVMRAKIHRATVTDANLHYQGSITLDPDLLDAAGMYPNEKVQVVNVNNGARLDTYIMVGERGSGVVCMNGPAARLAQIGDTVIVIAYAIVDKSEMAGFEPTLVHVDEANRPLRT